MLQRQMLQCLQTQNELINRFDCRESPGGADVRPTGTLHTDDIVAQRDRTWFSATASAMAVDPDGARKRLKQRTDSGHCAATAQSLPEAWLKAREDDGRVLTGGADTVLFQIQPCKRRVVPKGILKA